jgi:hypothetical protein
MSLAIRLHITLRAEKSNTVLPPCDGRHRVGRPESPNATGGLGFNGGVRGILKLAYKLLVNDKAKFTALLLV